MPRLPSLFVTLALLASPATAAEPDVAMVRGWLDEQLYMFAPGGGAQLAFETDGEPAVVAVDDGVEAHLHGATLWYGDVLLVLGDITLVVTAGEDALLQIDIDLAERIPVTDGSGDIFGELTLLQPEFTAAVDPETGIVVVGEATAGGTAFSLTSELAWLETGAIDFRWTAEQTAARRWTVDQLLAVAGLNVGTTAGYGIEVSALTTEGRQVGFDLESYLAFLDVGIDPLAIDLDSAPDARSIGILTDFIEHVDVASIYKRIRATEANMTLPADSDMAIAALDLAGTIRRLNGTGSFDLDYRYNIQGIALERDDLTAALAPREVDVTLEVTRLPVVGLLRAFEGYVTAVEGGPTAKGSATATLTAEIWRLLRDADIEVRLVDGRLDGPLLAANFQGHVRPDDSPMGATGLLTVELAGFANARRRLGELEPSHPAQQIAAALAVIELFGDPIEGRADAQLYRLEATHDGKVMLNGVPLGELLANLMPQRR